MRKTVALIILDGFGIGRKDATNPIHAAHPEMLGYLKKNFLYGSLQASGISVGLPWGEEGNSEVGHITIGAGKVIYQHYPRISLTIKNKEFFKNKELKKAFDYAKEKNSSLHFVGVLTSGNVHASFEHLEALFEFTKLENTQKLYIHIITDGRDSPPKSARELLGKLEGLIKKYGRGKIGSISGRYYAMDRDEHYDRTELAYSAMIGLAPVPATANEWLEKNYSENLTDEFVRPVTLDPEGRIKENDAVIFFNYREDSIRQLAKSFAQKDFDRFPINHFNNLFIVSFTDYAPKLGVAIAFPQEIVQQPLGKILEDAGRIQLRIAETEKYAHITYFFNGLRDAPFQNEYRILIPSQNLARHDEHPEMRAREIADRIIQGLSEGGSDFILANFANPDVIGHTGNFEAAIKTIGVIDGEIRRIFDATMKYDATLIITSDHGNVEEMANPQTGAIETKHDSNPVPIHIIGHEFISLKNARDIESSESETSGVLSDIAPTILELLGIPATSEMTGISLLKSLK